jgi:hypothetical protein
MTPFPYPNKVISRLRTKSWYSTPKEPPHLYYKVFWDQRIYTKPNEVLCMLHMTGEDARIVRIEGLAGWAVVYATSLMIPDICSVKEIGPTYDPRKD